MPSDTYHWLAKYYDDLVEVRRPFEKARRKIVGPLLKKVGSACDLGCGTGVLALEFARLGLDAYAVDLSPGMCRITRQKARKAGLKVEVIEGDMRSFTLPQPVELITSECDAINHLPQKRDLQRVFRAVAKALVPGGHFAFDVNNRLAFERIWALTWFLEKDPAAMVMRGGHQPGTDRAWIDVEWFIRAGKHWTRHHEHIEEVCWSAAEIEAGLEKAGFVGIQSWDAAPFFKDELTLPGNRTFWLARKG